jgi:D-beta-D-heptose 7-phosphate kinase / D-beta-D-heptose 1-phosphate adenosyltransferase
MDGIQLRPQAAGRSALDSGFDERLQYIGTPEQLRRCRRTGGLPNRSATLDAALDRLPNTRVLVLGDLMMDRYLWGEVDRISPEAPVPVVRYVREETRAGGAANVAHNLIALGCRVGVCGIVGADSGAKRLSELLRALGADVSGLIEDAARPTTEKYRVMAGQQQMLRVDREDARAVPADVAAKVERHLEAHASEYDGIIVSDYGKGLLTPAVMAAVTAIARKAGLPIIVDPKGTDYAKYAGVTCITPNEAETAAATRLPVGSDAEALAAAQALRTQLGLPSICITRGAKGVLALGVAGATGIEHRFLPARAREVYDVTGAGDTFISVFAALLFAKVPFFDAVEWGNLAAGLAVAKLGTSIVSRHELAAASAEESPPARKIFPATEDGRRALGELSDALHAQGKRIVFTNGCFDLLHAGHIQYLHDSKALGDVLVIGLNDDDSVRRLKGPTRPVIAEDDRAHLLAALRAVDYVALFAEDTPLDLIRAVKPAILTKGADYSVDTVVGHDLVTQWGGEVRLIPLKENRSTSNLIEKIVATAGRKR